MTEIKHRNAPLCQQACFAYPLGRTLRTAPALYPERVLPSRVPLGQPPSLHPLRHRRGGFVRGTSSVLWGCQTSHGRSSSDYVLGLPVASWPAPFAARQPWDLPILVQDVSGRAWGLGPRRVRPGLAIPPRTISPSATPRASAPWSFGISRLDTQPARTPVNASPEALRLPAHDSGPVWVATPSLYDSFIHYIPPILIGADRRKPESS